MDEISKIITDFINQNASSGILVYNEISLQNELGLFFKNEGYSVRFERNISRYITNRLSSFVKKEIDLIIFKGENEDTSQQRAAIELKFPRNGQYPEQMRAFLKDIRFMEQVASSNIAESCYVLTLVDDKLFYDAKERNANYPYCFFRGEKSKIPFNPPLDKNNYNKTQPHSKYYELTWKNLSDNHIVEKPKDTPMYYLLKISKNNDE